MEEEIPQNESFAAICQEVYRLFPAVAGKRPTVKLQQLPDGSAVSEAPTYLLTFYSQVMVMKDTYMPYWVRVVVDPEGKDLEEKILKISTSR